LIDILAWVLAGIPVLLTVLVHYETMMIASDRVIPWAQRKFLHGRRVMMISIGALMLGHIIEIWVFAFAMMLALQIPGFGTLSGNFDGTMHNYAYFSAVNYTSLGYGEILPEGPIRAIACSEALTGLLMIAWSASFTYLKMEQIWKGRREN
jgi:hypothetical protein